MINNLKYFLSSMDSRLFEQVRECSFERKILFNTGKVAVVAFLDPPIQLEKNGSWKVIEKVVLTARHEGHDLFPIKYFPCFVYVATLLEDNVNEVEQVTSSQLTVIGIAELYRTKNDATEHIFDKEK